MAIIETLNLTKRYNSLVALNNLSIKIEEGECYGYIGPNGAGKTTTIKILATLLRPTWGEAKVCNYLVGFQSRKIRPLIGYVPDFMGSYEDMVVQEYLEFFAAAYNITGMLRRKVVGDVLELTDLGGKRDAVVDSLSRGMKQRLAIARVLLHNPKVLLLDEPASGLDPRARIEIRELLKELRRMGKTIIISSHILHELAELCSSVGVIEQGKMIFSGPIADILQKARVGTRLCVGVAAQSDRANLLLRGLPQVTEVQVENGRLMVELNRECKDYNFLISALVAAQIPVKEVHEEEVNLETAFMRLTKGLVH
jgi:ABC-2 type transport system ATP-binding protein